MPRRSQRKNHHSQAYDDIDPEDDYELSQSRSTQRSQSQSTQKSEADISGEEKQQLVGTIIRYLLVADRAKTLIQRHNIIKNALKNNGKHYRQLMENVTATLREVFGYELVEIDGQKYFLVNAVRNDTPHLDLSQEEKAQKVLLFIALTHVFMSDDECSEASLWSLLKELQILRADNCEHPYFGNVRDLVNTIFVKRQYLEKVKVSSADPVTYTFKWGPRAKKELSKREVLQFMSKLYKTRSIQSWAQQYHAMLQSEKEK